jgi:Transglycosylase SLT domain/Transposase zinc-ribbon domain/ISXO2-like transposase domain
VRWASTCFLVLLVGTAGAQVPDARAPRDVSARWAEYYAAVYQVPVELVAAIIDEESGWNPYAVSKKGAAGIMQLMPATAVRFGVRNRFLVRENIRGGVAYLAWLLKLRWPEGFVCPRCGTRSAWTTNRNLLVCAGCQYQGSLTAGTIFQDTRKPLTLWFRAIWWVTTQKNGASALGLQRILGLGSYVTAWTWLHKLRRAMLRPGRDRLSGRVEVDETYVGGLEEGVRGRQTETKALVAIACEEDGSGVGRIRLRHIQDASATSLHGFVEEAISPAVWSTAMAGKDMRGWKRKDTGTRSQFCSGAAGPHRSSCRGCIWSPRY